MERRFRILVAEIGGGRIMTDCRVRVRPKVKPYLRGVLRLATAAALLYAGLAGMLAVSITWKVPARVGVPLSKPLAELNVSPGGRGAAVYWAAELAPTTVKLNGWLMKPTAVSGLMTAAADCVTLVGYSRLLGMTCLDWLGLYHERWATSELVVW